MSLRDVRSPEAPKISIVVSLDEAIRIAFKSVESNALRTRELYGTAVKHGREPSEPTGVSPPVQLRDRHQPGTGLTCRSVRSGGKSVKEFLTKYFTDEYSATHLCDQCDPCDPCDPWSNAAIETMILPALRRTRNPASCPNSERS